MWSFKILPFGAEPSTATLLYGSDATKIVATDTVEEVAKDRRQLGRLGGGGTEVVCAAGGFVCPRTICPPTSEGGGRQEEPWWRPKKAIFRGFTVKGQLSKKA